jgi:hypothetical protein
LELGTPDSPNLCSLALLSVERNPDPWEVDDLFRRSVEDLNFPTPDPEEWLRQYAREVAEGVISGVVEPLEGARELHGLAGTLGYPEVMMPWVGFDEHLFLDSNIMISEKIKHQAHALLREIPKKYF